MSDWSDFGALLRDTRTKFGWSLQDVSHRTRIPVFTLGQLEANDYSGFPSRAYAKSFLSQYSEHLGIDATEWLDNFQTGDALANLRSYEYLKDHDERVEASPLVLKRDGRRKPMPRREEPSKEKSRAEIPSASMQPLVLFLVTAAVITGAVFGFMRLSESLSEPAARAVDRSAAPETLRPLSGIAEPRSTPRDLSSVPRALPVDPDEDFLGSTSGTEDLTSTPTTQQTPPVQLASEPARAPARAVIVEE
jgi:cytoskeletal protein RodZ